MKQLFEITAKTILPALSLIICFSGIPCAQIPDKTTAEEKDIEVPIIRRIGSRYFRCYFEKGIYDETKFKKLLTAERCQYADEFLKTNFNAQTLIGYSVGGDCFMRASAKVYRNDHQKKYKVEITNYWGRCRAGGSYEDWLTIEKIPADYKLEFNVMKSDSAEIVPLIN